MKQIKIMMLSKRKIKRNFIIFVISSAGIYLLISLYFINHFYFRTEINGINVSLKAHKNVSNIIGKFLKDYKLQLLERNGEREVITGQDIEMRYNKSNTILQINKMQNPFLWIGSLFKSKKYYIKDLYDYNRSLLDSKINSLKCLNENIIEPHNVDYKYTGNSYEILREINGNKINKTQFVKVINKYISEGRPVLDLNKMQCYEVPKYTKSSEKTLITKNKLNRYVSTNITYLFGSAREQLDGTIIHQWLHVDEDLEVIISKEEVSKYINKLSKKYDTVGVIREFQTSTGKKIELKDGLYGWKINQDSETDALLSNIKQGDVTTKEPIYLQKAFSREGNEIGNTYIEINISKQYLWFYKDGKLIAGGSVVTGNPNRGNATVLGVYMVNYKQKDTTLTGPGYEAKITYWMPFFGDIGIHDAPWRYRFGGEIYKRNGSHGCVNAPLYLAKTIFENLEEGTPVVVYTE
ncbi:MAG: L,D-transpeptidase family protein [Clostridiales bacterium]|nr:L,D-transpeptidase family protein [Clostridiales bacterium]